MNVVMKEEASLEVESSCCELYLLGEKTPRSNEEMIRRYQEYVHLFGFSGRTLLYPNDTLYQRKLGKYVDLLTKVVGRDDSLLDMGCGYGSLVEPLFSSTMCKYQGIDIVPEFIEHGRKIYEEWTNVSFSVVDMEQYVKQEKPQFDWCVLLGVLNSVPVPNNLVEVAWEACKKGLFFDINSIEKKDVTRYNTFDIPHYMEKFQKLEADVTPHEVWDGCTILEVRKRSIKRHGIID